jgi:hypothetical protein
MDNAATYAVDWSHTGNKYRVFNGAKLTSKLPELTPGVVVVTENMPNRQCKEIVEAGGRVFRCSTHQTQKYRQECGIEKTDDNDAEIIYDLWTDSPEEFYEYRYDPTYYELNALYTHFKELQKTRVSQSNRLWQCPDSEVLKSSLESIEKMEEEVVKGMKAKLKKMPIYTQFLSKVKGIDVKTAAGLIAYTGDINRFSSVSCFLAYFGLHVVDGQAPRKAKGKMANWHQKGRALLIGVIGNAFRMQKAGSYESKSGKIVTRVASPYRLIYRSSEPKAPTVKLLVGKATERSEGDCLPAL